ncbi:MAG: carboxymuconolactone decarboxylase [Chitinophagaceae bacterium]|nr:MAG: carboxymuconolactone decarboxylase [Chitinophagaceae bacterium]
MPYIPLEEHLPGVTGLLEYRQATSAPLRELTQILLRGPSTLTETERELIATVVSHGNGCVYCSTSHSAAVVALSGDAATVECVKDDINTAPVTEKMKALLGIASLVRESGKAVTPQSIERAKASGATDLEIHDTVLIAALFSLYNRYVDGLATIAPTDPEYYAGLGTRLKEHGYYRLPQGYDHLKKKA